MGSRHGGRARRAGWAVAGGGALALVVSGCAASSTQDSAHAPGHWPRSASIHLSGLHLAAAPTGTWPAGAHVPLKGQVVNQGAEPDFLIDVSSPLAGTGHVVPAAAQRPGIMLAPHQPVRIGQPAPVAVLDGLRKPLRDGQLVEVTLTFTKAEPLHVQIPVGTPGRSATPTPTSTAAPGSSPSASPSPSPSGSAG